MDYRPDWLPKEERLEAYGASSNVKSYWITSTQDGTRYLWHHTRPKYARKKKWVKVRKLPTIRKVEYANV